MSRRLLKFDLAVKRRREIEAHARAVGAAETDDFDQWLIAWTWHNKKCADPTGALMEAARRMGRKGMRESEAVIILAEAKATRKCRTADNLGRFLGLPFDLRQSLGITTIGSVDVSKRERQERRKLNKLARDRRRSERKRRMAGAKPRADYEATALSRTKPWDKEGISRAQWYRRQQAKAA